MMIPSSTPPSPLLASSFILFLFLASSFAPSSSTPENATSGTTEFSYEEGPRGPENWEKLNPQWRACGVGKMQSPIDIPKKKNHHLVRLSHDPLKLSHRDAPANLHLGFHDVGLEWVKDGGFINWEDEKFILRELHTHAPSEHTIEGERFPLEVHFLHEGPNGKLLVVSLLYKYGKQNSFLAKVIYGLPTLLKTGKQDYMVSNAPISSIKFGDKYYHYTGSLTTPPCTEGVEWIIMKKKHSVSHEQVDLLMNAQLGGNARPVQALNGRTIQKHD